MGVFINKSELCTAEEATATSAKLFVVGMAIVVGVKTMPEILDDSAE